MFVMFYRRTLGSKLFPTIGFRTFNEHSSLEDLPDLETGELLRTRTLCPLFRRWQLKSPFIFAPTCRSLQHLFTTCQSVGQGLPRTPPALRDPRSTCPLLSNRTFSTVSLDPLRPLGQPGAALLLDPRQKERQTYARLKNQSVVGLCCVVSSSKNLPE
jgi:hypothetical protein